MSSPYGLIFNSLNDEPSISDSRKNSRDYETNHHNEAHKAKNKNINDSPVALILSTEG